LRSSSEAVARGKRVLGWGRADPHLDTASVADSHRPTRRAKTRDSLPIEGRDGVCFTAQRALKVGEAR